MKYGEGYQTMARLARVIFMIPRVVYQTCMTHMTRIHSSNYSLLPIESNRVWLAARVFFLGPKGGASSIVSVASS